MKSDCILQGSRSDFTRGEGGGEEACVSEEVICESTDMAGQEGGFVPLKINFSFSLAVFSSMTRKHFLRYPSLCSSKISSAF